MKLTKLVAAGAIALSGLAAGTHSASATVGVNNCTMTALRPQISGQYVRSQATIYCGVTRLVSAQAILMEDDASTDDVVGPSAWGGPWTVNAGSRITVSGGWVHCPNTEIGAEELFSKTRMIVNNVFSGYDYSLIQSFTC